jgi:hypothetical protein
MIQQLSLLLHFIAEPKNFKRGIDCENKFEFAQIIKQKVSLVHSK